MQPKSRTAASRVMLAVLAGTIALGPVGATFARADSDHHERAAMVQALTQSRISLADAIRAAEATGKGSATDAEFETSSRGDRFEVTTRSGDVRVKHRIDAATGAVLESIDRPVQSDASGRRASRAAAIAASPMTLLQAIAVAEGQGGKALSADFDHDNGALSIDVKVADASGGITKMAVNPASGAAAVVRRDNDDGDDD